MELRQLRYFIAVAEERHITRAAERLGIEQPSLSVQMKSLEKEMGVPLLRRHARGVELTAGGHAFLQAARATLASAAKTKEHVIRAQNGMEGSLCVGFHPILAWHPLCSDVVRAFRRAYPNVALEMRETTVQDLLELIVRSEIDVGIVRFPTSKPPTIVFEPLLDEDMMLVLPRNHRLLKGKRPGTVPRISLRELTQEPFVLYRRIGPLGLYAHLTRECQRVGFTPILAAQVDQIGGVLNLVAAEVGISIMGSYMRNFFPENVAYCHLDDAPGLHQPVLLALLETNTNPTLANFIAIAHERAAAHKKRHRTAYAGARGDTRRGQQ